MQKLHPTTQKRLYTHLGQQFNLAPDILAQPGTSIIPHAPPEIWRLPVHTVVRVAESQMHQFKDGQYASSGVPDLFYTVDHDSLLHVPSAHPIRQVTPDDAAAFAAFQAHCSGEDKQQGQITLRDEMIFGAFDGERMVAAASSFEWMGFIDFGILTDPAYRGRGLGRALIATLSRHHLKHDTRLPLYRHEATNPASGKVARAVGFQLFVTIERFRL